MQARRLHWPSLLRQAVFPLHLLAAAAAAHAAPDAQAGDAEPGAITQADIPANAPRFERFPAVGRFTGRIAEPDVQSHPRSRNFRTVIRQGAKQGPNFAGHYTIVDWWWGAGRKAYAVVDANTGQVFHPQELQSVGDLEHVESSPDRDGDPLDFRIDSRLVVAMGAVNFDSTKRGISWLVWEGTRFRRVLFVAKPPPDTIPRR